MEKKTIIIKKYNLIIIIIILKNEVFLYIIYNIYKHFHMNKEGNLFLQ